MKQTVLIQNYNFHIFKVVDGDYKALHVTSDYPSGTKEFEKEFQLFVESINLLKILFYEKFDKKALKVIYKKITNSYNACEKQLLIIVK